MNTYLNLIVFLGLHFSFTNFGLGQGKVEIQNVLNTAFTDTQVKFQYEKSGQLRLLNYNIPFLEKMEVRSETNDLDVQKQDMTLRVSTNSRKSRKAYKLFHESVQNMSEMEHESIVMNALYDRYTIISDLIYTKEKLRLEQLKFLVASDKVKLLKKMVSLASFDIVELIEAEDAIYRMKRTIRELENGLTNLRSRLDHFHKTKDILIEKKDILNVEEIEIIINQLKLPEQMHPVVSILSARQYNYMLEHEWEEAQTKFSLGFFQFTYGNNPERSFESNFSMGLGFDFPLRSSNRITLNEKKINILDAKSEYTAKNEELLELKFEYATKLSGLIDMHQLIGIQIQEGNADHALNEYSKQSSASPIALIKLKELSVRNEALLIEIEAEITTTYLQFLYTTGDLGKKPYRNFLDSKLSLLTQ